MAGRPHKTQAGLAAGPTDCDTVTARLRAVGEKVRFVQEWCAQWYATASAPWEPADESVGAVPSVQRTVIVTLRWDTGGTPKSAWVLGEVSGHRVPARSPEGGGSVFQGRTSVCRGNDHERNMMNVAANVYCILGFFLLVSALSINLFIRYSGSEG